MIRCTTRVAMGALVGALAGSLCLLMASTLRPGFALEMDRNLPRTVAPGFHGSERAGTLTFIWTDGGAALRLTGLDRRLPWQCEFRLRGGGPDLSRTIVEISADGTRLARERARAEFEDIRVGIPPRDRAGLTLGIVSSPTFVPGPQDRRRLGVQVDRIACAPTERGIVLPPRRALRAAAVAGAAFGVAVALSGASLGAIVLTVALVGGGSALLLSSGLAPYGEYPDHVASFAAWIAALAFTSWWLLARASGQRPGGAATFVLVFAAGALYLKILGLLHPSKPVVDALFHAHRLEWVLGGRYYFTQPMPSGVSFPYAIGLYVFAMPWTLITSDYMSLLRIIVSASEVLSGLLLYPLIVRIWGDRLTAAAAVVLFNVVPLPYQLIGNANMTNAFGQSVALVTLVVATLWPLTFRHPARLAGLCLLASLAFLSHISTFAQLLVALMSLAVLYLWRGDRDQRLMALPIGAATVLAGALAVGLYYGHFVDVYRNALRIRGTAAAATTITAVDASSPDAGATAPARQVDARLVARVRDALDLTMTLTGWPLLVLAGAGAWRLRADRARDRLVLLLGALGIVYVVFVGVGVVPRVDAPFLRYAAEFIGRVVLTTYPAVVVLASRGAVWAWRRDPVTRAAAVVLIGLAMAEGFRNWSAWFTAS